MTFVVGFAVGVLCIALVTLVSSRRVDQRRASGHRANALEPRVLGRCLCGHWGFDHSQALIGAPCLSCDCPGHMPDLHLRTHSVIDGMQRLPLAYFASPDQTTPEKEPQMGSMPFVPDISRILTFDEPVQEEPK